MKLKEMLEICYGKNQREVEVERSQIPILGTGGIIGYSSRPLYDNESVLIGRKGTIGMPFYINKPFWTIDTLFYTKINKQIVIPKYLYYRLSTIGLERYSEGAAVPSLTTKTLYEIEINVPNMETQQHIVNTIGTIDDLIEKNKRVIQEMETLGKCLSKLSNKTSKPLGSILDIQTGKLDANEADENGLYPFFTCSDVNLFINKYAFNCEAILVSGNGSRLGYINYFKGKFNAYQRTYVLTGKKYFYICYFQLLDRIKEITSQASGSAIPYLTKPMFDNFHIFISGDDSCDENTNTKLGQLLAAIHSKNEMNKKLLDIKQKLLIKYF